MYPSDNKNPFTVEENEHDMKNDIVSPLSPTGRERAWQNTSWNPAPGDYGYREPSPQQHSNHAIENVEEPSESVHFNRVDWTAQDQSQQGQEHPRSTLSSAEEFRLSSSRDEEDGLGIHIADHVHEIQNEKLSWEPTQPPASAYRPNTAYDFEDVELNAQKPRERRDSSSSKKRQVCTGNQVRIGLWVLVFTLPFVVLPVAIFGGVYHWGNPQGLCKAGGGSWEGATNECQY